MVLTPKFEVDQTDELVVIRINLPHVRVSNAEVITEGQDFSFYCKPYLLKLSFPCPLQEGEDANRATYNPDENNGTLTVELKKRTKGEHFPDLDLITKLLKKANVRTLTPQVHEIEVLHNVNFVDNDNDEENDENPSTTATVSMSNAYGFDHQYSKVFRHLREIVGDVLSLEDPDSVSSIERYRSRLAQEYADFDASRYIGDHLDASHDPIYSQMMDFKPFWIVAWEEMERQKKEKQSQEAKATTSDAATTPDETTAQFFDEQEQETLRSKLKNKEYLIPADSEREFHLLTGLIDLLFAYCYDVRLTEGEANSESPSNITRLSRQLSWLDDYFPSMETVSSPVEEERCLLAITFSMRRLLVYPYLRHWKVGRKVLADIARIFLLGKRHILKCLLKIYHTFERTDNYYLFNTIFLRDYCVWIQSVSTQSIRKLAKVFNNAKNTFEQAEKANGGKRWVGFHIVELDAFVQSLVEKENDDTVDGEEDMDEIPPEALDYSDVFTSEDPRLAYLQVKSDDSLPKVLAQEKAKPIEDIDAARAQLESMLLSPTTTQIADGSSKPLIEEVNEDDEGIVPLPPRRAVSPPPLIVPTLTPSVADEIQQAMLAQLADQQDQVAHDPISREEAALEEMLLASIQNQGGEGHGPSPLTADDVRKLFAAAPPTAPSAPTTKRVLIEELSSTTVEETNEDDKDA